MKLFQYNVTIISRVGAYGMSPRSTHSGIVLADSPDSAEQRVREEYDRDDVLALNICTQEKDLIELDKIF